jgi:hypothetical protein
MSDSKNEWDLLKQVEVHCYSGYRGEESPRWFRVGASRVDVTKILDRWLSPNHRYFKVRGQEGDVYILRHDPAMGRWELVFYRRAAAPAADSPE